MIKKLARAELLRGNALAAETIFTDVLERAPDDVGARIGAVEAAVALGNYPSVSLHLEHAKAVLRQTRDTPAARLGEVCRVLAERLGAPAGTAEPASRQPEATATGWDVRQAIERLKGDQQDDVRLRASMLLLLRTQATVIEQLRAVAAALFKRLQTDGRQPS